MAFYLAVTACCVKVMSSPDNQDSTAKVIADLSENVKAIKAELETLKRGATYSGSDLRTSTQDSVIEPGQDPPRQKDQGTTTVISRRRVKRIAPWYCYQRRKTPTWNPLSSRSWITRPGKRRPRNSVLQILAGYVVQRWTRW